MKSTITMKAGNKTPNLNSSARLHWQARRILHQGGLAEAAHVGTRETLCVDGMESTAFDGALPHEYRMLRSSSESKL